MAENCRFFWEKYSWRKNLPFFQIVKKTLPLLSVTFIFQETSGRTSSRTYGKHVWPAIEAQFLSYCKMKLIAFVAILLGKYLLWHFLLCHTLIPRLVHLYNALKFLSRNIHHHSLHSNLISNCIAAGVATAETIASSAPGPAGSLTLGSLLGSTCSDIAALLASEEFSILAGLVSDPEIASKELPSVTGTVVLAAPTNAAFTSLLSTVGAGFTDNKTRVFEVLANHIALASSAKAETATALSGEKLSFWKQMSGDAVAVTTADEFDMPTDTMRVTVQIISGTAFTIDTSPSDTIENIKAKIQAQQGLSPSQYRLIYNGKLIEDNRTVGDYNIPPQATLTLLMSRVTNKKLINFVMAVEGEPMPQSIAVTATNPAGGVITDEGMNEHAKVVTALACPTENQYAFAIDAVLVPKQFETEAAPAPAGSSPAPEPTPKPTPTSNPTPVPASSAGMASVGFAAIAAVAAAILA
jgi:large subunit ribosomal protein L40e